MRPPPPPPPQIIYVEKKRRTGCFTWLVAIVGGFILLVMFFAEIGGGNHPSPLLDEGQASRLTPRQEAQQSLEIVEWNWRSVAGGNVMEATFKIRNKGTKAFKDIEIKCVHAAASGTEIDSNTRTIYEIVKPGETKEFKNFNMGFIHSQAKSSKATIRNAIPID